MQKALGINGLYPYLLQPTLSSMIIENGVQNQLQSQLLHAYWTVYSHKIYFRFTDLQWGTFASYALDEFYIDGQYYFFPPEY